MEEKTRIVKPYVLVIRDGWGHNPKTEENAIYSANPEFTNSLMREYPTTLINASGTAVGLPDGYQGNSEVGHITIGSGRIIYQSMERINLAIRTGEFFNNKAFLNAIENCRKNNSTLHIAGILQQEGVHGHQDHCFAILELCRRMDFKNVLLHVISDGRDAPIHNTINNLRILLDKINEKGLGKIATISGRYFAMDRDKRWDRTRKAYECIVESKADTTFEDPIKCFEDAYAKGETDEFLQPKRAVWYEGIKENDSFIFYNFRTDRTRQLTRAMIDDDFPGWERKRLNVCFAAMNQFYEPMNALVAFPDIKATNLLGEIISNNGFKQLRISETEKYAHVTFFFNNQNEVPYKNEDRILIPSPKVATYDLKPEMSCYEVTDRLMQEIDKGIHDFIVVNIVNGDLVGHTGVWDSCIKAVKTVDESLKKLVGKVLEKDGVLLIFADHGNIEDQSEMWRTSHTKNPVPFILVSRDEKLKIAKLKEGKGLQDIAPTVLELMGIPKPIEMTGESIIRWDS